MPGTTGQEISFSMYAVAVWIRSSAVYKGFDLFYYFVYWLISLHCTC